jgi:hypothetical protein
MLKRINRWLRPALSKKLLEELDQMYYPTDPYLTAASLSIRIAELSGNLSFTGKDHREKVLWKMRTDMEREHRFVQKVLKNHN